MPIGLLFFLCIRRSMATLAPSTTSARRLFCPKGRMEFSASGHPDQLFVVIPTIGTPPPPDPKVTSPIRSRPPRFWTRNLSASRRSVIFNPCIEDDTGMTTTISRGTWTGDGNEMLGSPLPAAVYSVGAVVVDLLGPNEEFIEDTLLVVLRVR